MSPRQDAIRMISEYKDNSTKAYPAPGHAFEFFGENAFNEKAQRKFLSDESFQALQRIIKGEDSLNAFMADAIAFGMKEWALQKGATHFCHWFQPLTDLTAEKHDSFFLPDDSGSAIIEFKGKNLTQGEPDASSFPSGGIRTTFEARGYTTWDPSSPAFVFGKTLVIPSCFVSWSGEALDKKTPLLRSMEALNNQALRLLRLFGDHQTKKVTPTVGAEQEYFLIDKRFFNLRPDILSCGRSLLGAKPSKGQELEDQYLGSIPERVLAFMEEAELELIRLGVPVKTRHNEVAPSQYELALTFENANVAADHNMLVMDVFKKIAEKHSFACLFHEKPFANVNGSGKHNNWSMATDRGKNLLEPGETPQENAMFLAFCAATVRAVNKYSPFLRMGIASAGNDHRLGKHEAPPAIISVFLGGQLFEIFRRLANGETQGTSSKSPELLVGVSILPKIPRHTSDRNRTSPFAFTGNKFEFRAVGSSENVSKSNTILNTIVAESLDYFATELEKRVNEGKDFNESLRALLSQVSAEFQPVLFEGDNYSEAWQKEAERRGLPNISNTVDAACYYTAPEALELFSRYNVYSHRELASRQEIILEKYVKKISIEAKSLSNIARTMIIPAALRYLKVVGEASQYLNGQYNRLSEKLGEELKALSDFLDKLDSELKNGADREIHSRAVFARDSILPLLDKIRESCDRLEDFVCDKEWPLPKYREMLFIR